MVPNGKNPAPGDHEFSLKIFLARCPFAIWYSNKAKWREKKRLNPILNIDINFFYQSNEIIIQKFCKSLEKNDGLKNLFLYTNVKICYCEYNFDLKTFVKIEIKCYINFWWPRMQLGVNF